MKEYALSLTIYVEWSNSGVDEHGGRGGPTSEWRPYSSRILGFLTGALDFVGGKGGAVMDLLRVRRLFAGEQVARFGMTGPGGQPRVTPVPFAVLDDGDDGVVVCSLDVEPRSLAAAAQLRGLATAPRVSFLADHSGDGSVRWWVQATGVAEVLRRVSTDPRFGLAAAALHDRHPSLRGGMTTVVWTTVTGWSGWTGTEDSAAAAA